MLSKLMHLAGDSLTYDALMCHLVARIRLSTRDKDLRVVVWISRLYLDGVFANDASLFTRRLVDLYPETFHAPVLLQLQERMLHSLKCVMRDLYHFYTVTSDFETTLSTPSFTDI